jgi:hypothetical protein
LYNGLEEAVISEEARRLASLGLYDGLEEAVVSEEARRRLASLGLYDGLEEAVISLGLYNGSEEAVAWLVRRLRGGFDVEPVRGSMRYARIDALVWCCTTARKRRYCTVLYLLC